MGRDTQRLALFCVGMGASAAWWLIMSTNLAAETSFEHDTTLVLHICYLVVLLACSLAYKRVEPLLRKPSAIGLLSVLTAFALVPASLILLGMLDASLYIPCVAVAAVAKALIFLSWMMAFSAIFTARSGLVTMLGSMTLGWMLCLVVAGATPLVAAVATCLMPLLSGGCLIGVAVMAPRIPPRRNGMTVAAKAGKAVETPLVRLLPPLFVAGLLLYEFAPGFVTGALQAASGSTALIHTYAAVALFLAVALGLIAVLMRFEGGKRYANRFVVPLIAVGLLLVPLLGSGEQALAFACVIAGTSVFDAFVYSSFAERVQTTGISPLRLFAWGQLIIQAAILAAYVLGNALAGSGAMWVSGICLALVFFIIVGGRFDLYSGEERRVVTGVDIEGGPNAFGVEAYPPTDCSLFARACGYSNREEEILGLIARGLNAPAIADRLCIAPSTVKTHLAHMYRKADVANRQELLKKLEEHHNALSTR